MPTGSTLRGRPRETPIRTRTVEIEGAESVTVPGAVGGWAALAERYGRLGLDDASRMRSTRQRTVSR